jgi:hypothetical protein
VRSSGRGRIAERQTNHAVAPLQPPRRTQVRERDPRGNRHRIVSVPAKVRDEVAELPLGAT